MTDRLHGDRFEGDRLDAVLASGGEHLVVEPEAGRSHAGRKWRWWAVAAAVLVAASLGALAVAPVRTAVADWLGIGSTRVEHVPEGTDAVGDLPRLATDLPAVDPRDAEAALGKPLPDTGSTGLGPPQRLGLPPEGGVLLSWSAGDTTLWAHTASVRPTDLLRKMLDLGDRVEPVAGLGDNALLISGEHILETPRRRLAAGSVLIWIDDGIEYRLESNLDPTAMIDIARSIK
jgi:hypothetical protein